MLNLMYCRSSKVNKNVIRKSSLYVSKKSEIRIPISLTYMRASGKVREGLKGVVTTFHSCNSTKCSGIGQIYFQLFLIQQ